MKSMGKKDKTFTIKDFEKGLMLAGYISPKNEAEIAERKALELLEKKQAKEKQIIYFKRAVLAAEIVNQLHNEFTFGRVKFQKIVYLCEKASDMQLQNRYAKLAAGPFDHKFMHSINNEFKKQKWFDVKIDRNSQYQKPVYTAAEKNDKFKEYYQKYFSNNDEKIQYIINLFRKEKTRETELIATIYACWEEIILKGLDFNSENLFDLFYSWADEKKKFNQDEIIGAVEWMKEKGITPA